MKHPQYSSLCSLLVILPLLTHAELPRPGVKSGEAKWVRISVNMAITDPSQVMSIVDAAKAVGAETILLSDVKLLTWWFRSPGNLWQSRMQSVRNKIRNRGMNLVMETESIGYCHAPLAYNVNLAAGYPLVNVQLRVSGNTRRLIPVSAPALPNPSFENAVGNKVIDWGFQDEPGIATFVDDDIAHRGTRSIRLDASQAQMARIFSKNIKVEYFHQYTLSAWFRAESLIAGYVAILIRDASNSAALTSQHLSLPGKDQKRQYFSSSKGLTTNGWVEQRLAFNTQQSDEIDIVLGVWSGKSGRIWWDDLTFKSTPLLNLLRRNALPFNLTSLNRNGTEHLLREGTDYARVRDPKLGRVLSYDGVYDTYHTVADIRLKNANANLKPGNIVLLSGYHTMVTTHGQVGCSWSDRRLKYVIKTTHMKLMKEFSPDGIMLAHNEIRTGGWEPREVSLGTSGKALAAFLRWEVNVVRKETKNRPYLYIWSDMIDPYHNAVRQYYQMRSSLIGSWRGVSPDQAVVVNWNGNFNVPKSYAFFDDRGYTQIAAGYYDQDTSRNREKWVATFNGRRSAGSMYTTWEEGNGNLAIGDYSEIQTFANLWW